MTQHTSGYVYMYVPTLEQVITRLVRMRRTNDILNAYFIRYPTDAFCFINKPIEVLLQSPYMELRSPLRSIYT